LPHRRQIGLTDFGMLVIDRLSVELSLTRGIARWQSPFGSVDFVLRGRPSREERADMLVTLSSSEVSFGVASPVHSRLRGGGEISDFRRGKGGR
jgi:hypothetical protein